MNEEALDNLVKRSWNTFQHEHQKILKDYSNKMDDLFIKLMNGLLEIVESELK